MLKVGVAGAGHLGKIHLKLLQQSSLYELVGFYDTDENNGEEVASKFGYKYFSDLDELLDAVEVLDIVTPTLSHYEVAKKAISKGKHVFLEKPIAKTEEEAREIIELAKKHNVKGQVGHVERFNPAFTAVQSGLSSPLFIEAHRLAEFNPRGTDVPVVLDLMIHDLDVILSMVKSEVKEIHSSGVSVISETPDIANVRLAFENGCVANITTSRISMKNMRKMRIFQKDAYISVDFLEKKSEIIRMEDLSGNDADEFAMVLENAEKQQKKIWFEYPVITANNAILDELESFAKAIMYDEPIPVTLEDGTKALALALQIIERFNK
ncbi:Gfo/Idh/MocA family oxidoreductase [Ornithobacterium rhinotracheale]|uniref:Gfo/Idh/MocA family oxidoreductase n=1 Tax=Ornithobacterium rhinotracheale TaxID=28251 RepID=UPI001FF695BD|nr:Gfo/Idh/MocA family oxidoreductase [Ornithobacterium rhinotracheale]MCK0200753.1 Gfo/Idh/MocA family oxidoreductase [Ornithobacterium rhinotracheale]